MFVKDNGDCKGPGEHSVMYGVKANGIMYNLCQSLISSF